MRLILLIIWFAGAGLFAYWFDGSLNVAHSSLERILALSVYLMMTQLVVAYNNEKMLSLIGKSGKGNRQ